MVPASIFSLYSKVVDFGEGTWLINFCEEDVTVFSEQLTNIPKDGFDWSMNNAPEVPIVIFAGVITNDDIKVVIVKQKTLKKQAKIIETKQGVRVWFVTFKFLEEADKDKPDPLKIEAYSRDGKLIWKDGVY